MPKNSVQVALRIRPQSTKEKFNNNEICIYPSSSQSSVSIGKHSFNFDHTFGFDSTQEEVYRKIGAPLVESCLQGYNATIFAYGQTGSGKTFSMGTAADPLEEKDPGLVPRCLENLFSQIEKIKSQSPNSDFQVNCYFMELYNEELRDLLCPTAKEKINIHQGAMGNIYFTGQTTRLIDSYESAISCLNEGSMSRKTASTLMNSVSSRSHSVFTLDIRQFRYKAEDENENPDPNKENKQPNTVQCGDDKEMLYAKFNFVDLAGSERLKRTGATGEQAKEGISINRGLLALGNVISILSDHTKAGSHVPYRDSKLTRLLQDSLGGNSRTIMLACVSPSDCDFLETLNTLKYASRARTITNKVVVNQDKNSRLLATYREEIKRLKVELDNIKSGKVSIDQDGNTESSDMYKECCMLRSEIDKITQENKSKALTIKNLSTRNATLLADVETYSYLDNIIHKKEDQVTMSEDLSTKVDSETLEHVYDFKEIIYRYTEEIENLRSQLWECQTTMEIVQTHYDNKINLFKSKEIHSIQAMDYQDADCSKRSLYQLEEETIEHYSFTRKSLKLSKKKNKRRRKETAQMVKEEEPNTTFFIPNKGDNRDDCSSDPNTSQLVSPSGNPREANEDAEEEEEVTFQSDQSEEDNSGSGYNDDEDDDDCEEDESEENKSKKITQDRLLSVNANINAKVALLTDLQSKHAMLEQEKFRLTRTCETLAAKKREAEQERDLMMSNIGSLEQTNKEKFKKMKEELDLKIKNLRDQENELKKARQVQENRIKELKMRNDEIKKLKNELTTLRSSKLALTKQLRDEIKKAEQLKTRSQQQGIEIRRLKDQKDREMRAIKASHDLDIRKKNEEIIKLRKMQSNFNNASCYSVARSRAPRSFYDSTTRSFNYSKVNNAMKKSEESARLHSKYNSVMKSLEDGTKRYMTVAVFEKDLENWITERNNLVKKINSMKEQNSLEIDQDEKKNTEKRINSLNGQLRIVQESIKETQEAIMVLHEVSDGFSIVQQPKKDLNKTISVCQSSYTSITFEDVATPTNLRYLLYRIYDSLFENLVQQQELTQKNSLLEAQIITLKNEIDNVLDENLLPPCAPLPATLVRSSSTETIDIPNPSTCYHPNTCKCGCRDFSHYNVESDEEKPEVESDDSRKMDFEHDKDLFNSTLHDITQVMPSLCSKPQRLTFQLQPKSLTLESDVVLDNSKASKENVCFQLLEQNDKSSSFNPISQQAIDKNVFNRLAARKSQGPVKGKMRSINSVESLQTNNCQSNGNIFSNNGITTALSLDTMSAVTVRFPDDGNQMRTSALQNPQMNSNFELSSVVSTTGNRRDSLDVFNKTIDLSAPSPDKLTQVAIADGHSRSVLDVDVFGETMVTGSKDRSAKIWDLTKMQEVNTIKDFPSNVRRVKFNSFLQQVVIACSHFINIRDYRDTRISIMTFLSSGGRGGEITGMDRQDILPPGETLISDISICSSVMYSEFIYFAAANSVKVIDVRNKDCVAKLTSSGQTPVMSLAVSNGSFGNLCQPIYVATGSKDHNVRVFNISDSPSNILQPKMTLEPPHYDGIETLSIHNHDLISGGRDMAIKKWNLESRSFHNISNAHKDWVLSLAISENRKYMFSSCRAGTIKIWDFDTCKPVQEISDAHNDRINKITINQSNQLFSASDDKSVKIWKYL